MFSKILFAFLLFSATTNAQCISNTGREFYVSFLVGGSLFITSDVNTTGQVGNPNTGFLTNFTVAANSFTRVPLPALETVHTLQNSISKKGFIVTTVDPVSIMSMHGGRANSDAALIYPLSTLGLEYIVSGSGRPFVTDNFSFSPTALIVATEDSTTIEINPTAELTNNHPAALLFTIKLNKGETYTITGKENISGTIIKVTNGTKPIAVFCGQRGATIPLGFGATENIFEQINPITKLGRVFISPILRGRGKNILQITAASNNSSIKLDGSIVATLQKGQTFTIETNNTAKYVESSQPVQLALFGTGSTYDSLLQTTGDPTFMIVQPVQQMLRKVTFISPVFDSIKTHKLCIIVNTAHANSTVIDGNNIGSLFLPVSGNANYSIATLDVAAGKHELINQFGLIAYANGYGFRQAYGYCTGAAINEIYSPTHFTLNNISSADSIEVNVCKGSALFKILQQDANSNFIWNFGDGSPTVQTAEGILQQVHEFKRTGNYIVTLTIINCAVQSETRILKIKVYEPYVAFMPTDTIIAKGASIVLFPLHQQGVVAYNWQPNYNITDITTKNPAVSPLINTEYLLTVTDTSGCTSSASFNVKVFDAFFMPNAFTPNADGRNDVFRIPPGMISNLKNFSIYNRWGQLVFSTSNILQGWYGKFNGVLADSGTYVWSITYLSLQNKNMQVSGIVLVIR